MEGLPGLRSSAVALIGRLVDSTDGCRGKINLRGIVSVAGRTVGLERLVVGLFLSTANYMASFSQKHGPVHSAPQAGSTY